MIRRLPDFRSLFGVDEPDVWILAPAPDRAVPCGDTRRGTAWIFHDAEGARAFADWVLGRHGLAAVPVRVPLPPLCRALAGRDLTWVLDPMPRAGSPSRTAFKAPLPH